MTIPLEADASRRAGALAYLVGRPAGSAHNRAFCDAMAGSGAKMPALIEAYCNGWTVAHLADGVLDAAMPSVVARALILGSTNDVAGPAFDLLRMQAATEEQLAKCVARACALVVDRDVTADLQASPLGRAWIRVLHCIATDPSGPGFEMLNGFARQLERISPAVDADWNEFWRPEGEIWLANLDAQLRERGLHIEPSLSALDDDGEPIVVTATGETLEDEQIDSDLLEIAECHSRATAMVPRERATADAELGLLARGYGILHRVDDRQPSIALVEISTNRELDLRVLSRDNELAQLTERALGDKAELLMPKHLDDVPTGTADSHSLDADNRDRG